MRIGMFTDAYTPDINGVVSSIVTLQNELEKQGHTVFIITNHKGFLRQMEKNVLRLPGLELKKLYGYKMSTPYQFRARDEIRKMELDVIHVHTEFGIGMFGRSVAKNLKIPIVSTYHTMYEDYTHYVNRIENAEIDKVAKKIVSTFSRSISNNVQGVIAPSEKTKDALLRYGVNSPIYVIPTGLDFSKFSQTNIDQQKVVEIKKEYGIVNEDNVVTYIGRIAKEKSIELIIDAFQYIDDEHIKLMIVGGGPYLESLKKQTNDLQLNNKIIFTDKKDSADIPLYYACASCFVSPSLSETQGLTYIEALSCNLPVFARYDEILDDLVIDDKTGYFFEDAKDLARKLTTFFNEPKKKQADMRKNARSVVEKYDAKVFASKVLSVYYQAIDDFEDAYEVEKIKSGDNIASIFVKNDKEESAIKIMISIEDYFMYKIQVGSLLTRIFIDELKIKEQALLAEKGCIRKLRLKDYTTHEIKQYVQNNFPLVSAEALDHIIQNLMNYGYIDDVAYVENKIEHSLSSLQGKDRVRRNLLKKGIASTVIDEAMKEIDDEDEYSKAMKLAIKLEPSLKDKAMKQKKQNIIQKLITNGFESGIARNVANHIDYEDHEEEALQKTIQKAIRLYQRKYQNKELYQKIYVYCITKGFESSNIKAELDKKEW